MNEIIVTIPNPENFFSLYADGILTHKKFDEESEETRIWYPENSVILLYYTYPMHRRVYLVRFRESSGKGTGLPGISAPVKVLFTQYASRVDKTKRAFSYIHTHYPNAFSKSDSFYHRLNVILKKKGKLDYFELDALCRRDI